MGSLELYCWQQGKPLIQALRRSTLPYSRQRFPGADTLRADPPAGCLALTLAVERRRNQVDLLISSTVRSKVAFNEARSVTRNAVGVRKT